jgi:hypothetical protein
MNTFFKNHLISKLFVLSMLLVMVFWVSGVSATTPNSPTIDGTIDTTTEWAVDELLGTSGGSVSRNLYLTWDATNLYIGITSLPTHVTIFFDTVTGGQNLGIAPGVFSIAGSGGYDFAWRRTNTNVAWFTDTGTGWAAPVPPPGGSQAAGVGDLEMSIPISGLGITSGSTVRILVLAGTSHASPVSYWPNVSGNQLSPSISFSQAIILNNVGSAGQSPGTSPTAVSLQSFTADNPANGLIALTGAAALILLTGLIVLRRRPSKA